MKFETTTEQLLTAVSTAARFAERKPNLPILSTILIIAEGGRLTLRATNLECGVEVTIPTKISIEGTVAVQASTLLGFLSNVRGKSVSVNLVGEVLKFETERAAASLKTISHEDFPILPQVPATNSFKVKATDLSKAIRSVAYCASLSAVKPEQQSILVYGETGKLITVATDSFRLAEKQITLRSTGDIPQLLIPARNAAELMRILDAGSGEVEVYYNENQISTHVEGVYYTSRLIDGTFPNYRQIIPKTFATEAVVLREDFSTSLKALSIFADKFSQVTIAVDSKNKNILLSSRNPDVGEQTSTVRATIQGEDFTMSFNGRYLADSVQAVAGESIRINANGPGKAMLIKDAVDESFFYLAMPMNR